MKQRLPDAIWDRFLGAIIRQIHEIDHVFTGEPCATISRKDAIRHDSDFLGFLESFNQLFDVIDVHRITGVVDSQIEFDRFDSPAFG